MSVITENPILLLVLVVLGFGIAAVMVWFKFGGALSARFRGAEKVPCLLLSRSPVIEKLNLVVDDVFFVSNPKTEEAWAYIPEAIQYDAKGNALGLLLTHDTCMPQFTTPNIDVPRMYEEFAKWAQSIADRQVKKAWESEINKAASNAIAEWLGLGMLLAVGGAFAIAIIMAIQHIT